MHKTQFLHAKRLIGRSFEDKTVKKDIGKVPFKIVNSDNNEAWVEGKGKKVFTFSNFSFYIAKNERNCREIFRSSSN